METLILKFKLLGKNIKDEDQDLVDIIMPKINVYLTGHGSYAGSYGSPHSVNLIAGISFDAQNNQQSDFERLLHVLSMGYVTQTLTIDSCFTGGSFKQIVTNFKNQAFFENISYPILLMSGLFAMSNTSFSLPFSLNVSKEEFPDYIYTINNNYFYGPKKKYPGDKNSYVNFFNYLNHTETYQVNATKTEQAYSYTAYKPEYTKAIDSISELFYEGNYVLRLNNIAFVRLPRSSWASTLELDKRIKTITPILAATAKNGIVIGEDVSITLLSTPYVQYPITIKGAGWIVPTIIGSTIGDRIYYCIEEIISPNDINDLGETFFNSELLNNLAQSFVMLIKKATCGKKQYSNIILFFNHFEGDKSESGTKTTQVDSLDELYLNEKMGEYENRHTPAYEYSETLYKNDPGHRFAIAMYQDEKANKIKAFVYKGRDKDRKEKVLKDYSTLIKTAKKVAQANVVGLQQKIKPLDTVIVKKTTNNGSKKRASAQDAFQQQNLVDALSLADLLQKHSTVNKAKPKNSHS